MSQGVVASRPAGEPASVRNVRAHFKGLRRATAPRRRPIRDVGDGRFHRKATLANENTA